MPRRSRRDHQKRLNVWVDLSVYLALSGRCDQSRETMAREVQRALMQYLGMESKPTRKPS